MEPLATIEQIEQVLPHPNADRLELVIVKGYQCIVGKDMAWQVGDLCVLIQPDTVLPDVEWAKPYKRSNRVKAIRLRGEWSFGIVEQLSILPDLYKIYHLLNAGDDVTETLGITKYEAPEPQDESARGGLPYGMPKTDETRWQNVRDLPYDEPVLVTQKIDGQSATYYYKDGEFGVTGRKLEFKTGVQNRYTAHVERYNLENKLRQYCERHGVNLALRGESYGQGIQNFKHNPHAKMEPGLAFYSVWLIDERRYATPFEQHSVWNICEELDLPTVPLVDHTFLDHNLIDYYANLKKLNDNYFEGVVITGDGFSFKVINLEYDSRK